MKNFDSYFQSDGPSFSQKLAWRGVECGNSSCRSGSKTFRIGLLQLYASLTSSDSESARRNSIVVQFTTAGAFLSLLSFLFWIGSSFRTFFWLFINLVMRKNTLVSSLTQPFHFCRIGTRADATISRRRSRTNTSQIICTGRRMDPWLLCLGYFSLPRQLRPRDTVGSESVAAVCSGFSARSWFSCLRLHLSPCEHCPFFFPLVTDTFPPSTPIDPCRLLITAPNSILPCLA